VDGPISRLGRVTLARESGQRFIDEKKPSAAGSIFTYEIRQAEEEKSRFPFRHGSLGGFFRAIRPGAKGGSCPGAKFLGLSDMDNLDGPHGGDSGALGFEFPRRTTGFPTNAERRRWACSFAQPKWGRFSSRPPWASQVPAVAKRLEARDSKLANLFFFVCGIWNGKVAGGAILFFFFSFESLRKWLAEYASHGGAEEFRAPEGGRRELQVILRAQIHKTGESGHGDETGKRAGAPAEAQSSNPRGCGTFCRRC